MRLYVALMVLASVTCTGSVFAAEPPAAKPAPAAPNSDELKTAKPDDESATKADDKPAAKPDQQQADADADAAEAAPPTKSPADQKPSPQRFIPSEQVRADFDVSFPIDI
jgi:hypothetical protein